MSNIAKNFLGFVSVIVGSIIFSIAYVTDFTSLPLVGSLVLLSGIVLFFGGGIYLFIKFMRWLINGK
jgi:hypothetical protein